MTEMAFLLDLLLNQKLSNPVKKLISERLKAIELSPAPASPGPRGAPIQPGAANTRSSIPHDPHSQAPSTQAILEGQRPGPTPIDPSLPAPIHRGLSIEAQPKISTAKGVSGPRKW